MCSVSRAVNLINAISDLYACTRTDLVKKGKSAEKLGEYMTMAYNSVSDHAILPDVA